MKTSDSDHVTDVSQEELDECIRFQGVIAPKPIEDSQDDDDLRCQLRSCNNVVHGKCVICSCEYEFCFEHFYHCYHEPMLFKEMGLYRID